MWGARANELQTTISGNRLKNLNMLSMIIKNRKVKHLEGSFYYPKYGYGSIFDSIAKQIDYENISLDSRINKIFHDGKKIKEIEFENGKTKEVGYIVNTLPIDSITHLATTASSRYPISGTTSGISSFESQK